MKHDTITLSDAELANYMRLGDKLDVSGQTCFVVSIDRTAGTLSVRESLPWYSRLWIWWRRWILGRDFGYSERS